MGNGGNEMMTVQTPQTQCAAVRVRDAMQTRHGEERSEGVRLREVELGILGVLLI